MTTTQSLEAPRWTQIQGNASDRIKQALESPTKFASAFHKPGKIPPNSFAKAINDRMVVTEVSVLQKAEEPNKVEGRAVLEIEVCEDMVNGVGSMHGGCTAYLIDMASSYALAALSLHEDGKIVGSVSQSLNVIYHSPAMVGDRVRLVNTTLTVGRRAESVRTEIWNVTHQRLVASGTHIKMAPSPAPVKAAL